MLLEPNDLVIVFAGHPLVAFAGTDDEETGDLFLVVGPGERYEGMAGENDHQVIRFEQHGILLENKSRAGTSDTGLRVEQLPPGQLWRSDDLKSRVEFYWRMSIPVVLAVLALVAVPLAYIAPRHGRFGKVGFALLVYIVYFNLLAFTRAQLETGALPLALNFWWVHAIFIGLGLALIYRRNRGTLPWTRIAA